MSIENELKTFSIRLPVGMCAEVDELAKGARRTRNAEITNLIEIALRVTKAREQKLKQEATTLQT